VDSDELLASYIARLECLEDLEKDRSITYNNNETSSGAPKIYPHGVVYPSLAPLPLTNNANYTYGMHATENFLRSKPAISIDKAKFGHIGWTDARYQSDRSNQCVGDGAQIAFATFCRAKFSSSYFF
jgi:hypothetical protein